MQRTLNRQRTETTEAVRFVESRVLGDLLAIHEKFRMGAEDSMRSLAHDVGVGLRHDCLECLRLFLFPRFGYEPHRAYVYHRAAPGSFDHSPHSGRIARDGSLVDGRFEFEVWLRDRLSWEQLKREGRLRIPWGPCVGRSTRGMCVRPDGGYASGDVALSRTYLTW